MNSKSAVSFLFLAIFASATTLACSGADPTAATPTTSEPAPACTNCGSSAIVVEPVPSALPAPAPALNVDAPVVINDQVRGDAGAAPSEDAGTDASDNAPDANTDCTMTEVTDDAGGFGFEVHCP